jgi:hypothetical protein
MRRHGWRARGEARHGGRLRGRGRLRRRRAAAVCEVLLRLLAGAGRKHGVGAALGGLLGAFLRRQEPLGRRAVALACKSKPRVRSKVGRF